MNSVDDGDQAALARKLEKGCLELRDGRYDRGWIAYELRHRLHPIPASLFQPQWQGEPLDGKHIMLHREQGVGDEIWFASAVPDAIDRAERCTITCDPRLETLYQRSFGTAVILPQEDILAATQSETDADYHAPIGNLFTHLRNKIDSFPADTRYLIADDDRVAVWRQRLERTGIGRKIGISWQGRGGQREANRHLWHEILKATDCQFVNVQFGDVAGDLEDLRASAEIIDFDDLDAFNDLDDLAALMTALDVVICVPNTNVHLAAATGNRVWIPFDPQWGCFWIVDGTDVPWYRTAEIFSVADSAGWPSVGRSIREQLEALRLST